MTSKNMKKCEDCDGLKKIRGLGMSIKKCDVCKGAGVIVELDVKRKKEKKKS